MNDEFEEILTEMRAVFNPAGFSVSGTQCAIWAGRLDAAFRNAQEAWAKEYQRAIAEGKVGVYLLKSDFVTDCEALLLKTLTFEQFDAKWRPRDPDPPREVHPLTGLPVVGR